jgi:hypothetical protein
MHPQVAEQINFYNLQIYYRGELIKQEYYSTYLFMLAISSGSKINIVD